MSHCNSPKSHQYAKKTPQTSDAVIIFPQAEQVSETTAGQHPTLMGSIKRSRTQDFLLSSGYRSFFQIYGNTTIQYADKGKNLTGNMLLWL